MGLFSFLKEAGKKLFGSKEEEKAKNPELTQEQLEQKQKQAMLDYIQSVGFQVKNFDLNIDAEGNVVLTGECETRADFEKIALTAGNIAGVAQVENKMIITSETEAPVTSGSTYYTVEKGDSLWKIAEANYQDGSKYPIIFEANVPMIKDADEIYPGQVLRIPALTA
jgi:nucleoid-associated protein YgaU